MLPPFPRLLALVVVLATTLSSGCITYRLRDNTIRQAGTYADIHEQQVLNNVAKFVYDINSLPSFSWSNQAVNQLQDTGALDSTTTWARIAGGIYGWMSSTLHPSATRVNQENWTLQPINDPRKLDLMRCAYQQVVRGNMIARGLSPEECCHSGGGISCPDCEKRFNTFYTGKPDTKGEEQDKAYNAGGVTNRCLGSNPAWFAWGCKRDVPKHCPCLKVGHYCGVWVWVLPGGEDELAKLTLAILDYAVNVPAAVNAHTKQVTYYLDRNFGPATQSTAYAVVSGTVAANKSGKGLVKSEIKQEIDYLTSKKGLRSLTDVERNKLTDQIQELQLRYNQLPEPVEAAPQIYQPSIDEVSPLKLQQLQLRLNTLTPIPPTP